MTTESFENHILFLKAASTTVDVLQNLDFSFDLLDDDDHEWLIIGNLETEIGRIRLMVAIRDNPCQWVLFAYHPLVIVNSMRAKTAELCMRINDQLVVGSYELNMDDGHLRYRQGFDFTGMIVPPVMIENAITLALSTLAVYHTPVVRALFDGLDAKEVLAGVQNLP